MTISILIRYRIAEKFGRENVWWRIYSYEAFGRKNLANKNARSAKGLLIVITTFDGFSLANRRQFAKLDKL